MKLSRVLLLLLAAAADHALALEYQAVPDWYHLAPGRSQMGPMHGDIAVSSAGEVYVSTMDAKAALQVYAPDGKFLRLVPDAPPDFHGFVIRQDADGEFIYGPRLGAGVILKLTLDGKEVLSIPASAIPDAFKKAGRDGKLGVRLTAMDVGPGGDLFVVDGYSSDFIHRFDKAGKYLKSFGGKAAPYGFNTLHKIAIDSRFDPPRLIGTDRANGRVVHLSLDGEMLGVVASDLLMPAAVVVHGDLAIVAEIKGRMTALDKAGRIAARFGANDVADEVGTNKTEPDRWRPGIVTAPHGVACDARGHVVVAEYNLYGRIHRFDRK
jgi:hypothetical protein